MFRRLVVGFIILCFIGGLINIPQARAGEDVLNLPAPGTRVNLSPAYEPALVKGLTVHQDNPFLFDFIVDSGNGPAQGPAIGGAGLPLRQEADRLIKYFFACLTIPEKDLWVNLSPYEKNRMIPQALGRTALGQDLLAQDYVLKQLTASLIYPEKDLGREFWNRIYEKAQRLYGTTQIPVNTFNKVWILADKASVYENNQTAFVIEGHLKVMLEEDYLASQKHQLSNAVAMPQNYTHNMSGTDTNSWPKMGLKAELVSVPIVRDLILPEIEKEVNTGKNFASLRQILNSLILANWYKNNLKEALLNHVYADLSKTKGIERQHNLSPEKIYRQYLKAYQKGVFNYIKEDVAADGQRVSRKYFSGGFAEGVEVSHPKVFTNQTVDFAQLARLNAQKGLVDVTVSLELNNPLRDVTMAAEDSIDARNISQEVRTITADKKVKVGQTVYSALRVARALLAIDDYGRMSKTEVLDQRTLYFPLLYVLPLNGKLGRSLIEKLSGDLKMTSKEKAYPDNLAGLGLALDGKYVDSATQKAIARWAAQLLFRIYDTESGGICDLDAAMSGGQDLIMIKGVSISRLRLEHMMSQLRKLTGEENRARRIALVRLAQGKVPQDGIIIGEGIVGELGLFSDETGKATNQLNLEIAKIVLALVSEHNVVTKLWDPRRGASLSVNETLFIPVAEEVETKIEDVPQKIELEAMPGHGMELETAYKIDEGGPVVNSPLIMDKTISVSKQDGSRILELTNIGQGMKVTNVSSEPLTLEVREADAAMSADDNHLTYEDPARNKVMAVYYSEPSDFDSQAYLPAWVKKYGNEHDFSAARGLTVVITQSQQGAFQTIEVYPGDIILDRRNTVAGRLHYKVLDAAMNGSRKKYGGIDLTRVNSRMTVARGSQGVVKVGFDPALIARIMQEGVRSAVPVIINVMPISLFQMRLKEIDG